MHRALLVEDILEGIFSFLPRKSLVVLARTAPLFHQPASRIIWRSITDYDYSLLTLTRFFFYWIKAEERIEWADRTRYGLEQRFRRFGWFAKLVQHVDLRFSSLENSSLEVDTAIVQLSIDLNRMQLGAPFPSLQSISSYCTKSSHLALVFLLLVPSVTSLELRVTPDFACEEGWGWEPNGFLDRLVSKQPGLVKLSIFHVYHVTEWRSSWSPQLIARTCMGLPQLRELSLDSSLISPNLIAFLSGRPTLHKLYIEPERSPKLSTQPHLIVPPLDPFRRLESLHFASHGNAVLHLLRCIDGPLAELELTMTSLPSSAIYPDFFDTVSRFSASLRIFKVFLADANASDCDLRWEWVEPLYACSGIETFVLHGHRRLRPILHDYHLAALASAWPSLEVLDITWPIKSYRLGAVMLSLSCLVPFALSCPRITNIALPTLDSTRPPASLPSLFPPRPFSALQLSFPSTDARPRIPTSVAVVLHSLWPDLVIRIEGGTEWNKVREEVGRMFWERLERAEGRSVGWLERAERTAGWLSLIQR